MRRCAACSLSSKRVRGLPLRPDRLAPDLAAQEVTLEIIKPQRRAARLDRSHHAKCGSVKVARIAGGKHRRGDGARPPPPAPGAARLRRGRSL